MKSCASLMVLLTSLFLLGCSGAQEDAGGPCADLQEPPELVPVPLDDPRWTGDPGSYPSRGIMEGHVCFRADGTAKGWTRCGFHTTDLAETWCAYTYEVHSWVDPYVECEDCEFWADTVADAGDPGETRYCDLLESINLLTMHNDVAVGWAWDYPLTERECDECVVTQEWAHRYVTGVWEAGEDEYHLYDEETDTHVIRWRYVGFYNE